VQRRQCRGTRICAGIVPAQWALLRLPSVCFALATAACLLIGGCSPGAEYPVPVFPAIQDKPPQRPDTTMNQLEVQKTTEDLISQRDRLNAQAPQQAPQSAQAQNPQAQNARAGGPTAATGDKAANAATAAKKTVRKHAAQQAAAAPPATTASAQGAGAQASGVQAAGTDLKP
jgi:hypothetical protein